jgi:hypothetical protein
VILAAVLAAASAGLLTVQAQRSREVAREVEPLLTAPAIPGVRLVLAADSPFESTSTLMYTPYLWAGTHFARRSRGTIVNAAWLSPDSPVVPFTTRRPSPWDNHEPHAMAEYLRQHPDRLPPADAIVGSHSDWAKGEDRSAEILGLRRTVFANRHLSLKVR